MEARRARAFCAEASLESAEPLGATASRVDRWILLEYRGVWGYDALGSSGLPARVKERLRHAAAQGWTKVLFVRRTERRRQPRLRVFWGRSAERGSWLSRAELDRYEELLELDLEDPAAGAPVEHPMFLVCTHGKHDRCCARYGRPLYAALAESTDPEWAWQCSHVGGDRFAGNLVVLPEGLYFGRVAPDDLWTVVDEYLAGRISLSRYRGRSCYSFRLQAAERAAREATGASAIDAIEVVSSKPIRLRVDGRVVELEAAEEAGPLGYLTCSADSLKRPRRYAARILPERGA
jgi:hypothetical protein